MSKRKKRKAPLEGPPDINRYILSIPFFAVILLALVGTLVPGRLTWGIGFLGIAGPTVAVIVVILAAVVASPPVAARLAALLSVPSDRLTRLVSRLNRPVLVTVASLVAVVVLFHWRSRSFVYGDGYIILSDASAGEDLVLFNQHYLQILTIYLNHYAYEIFGTVSGWSADEVVGMSNAIGGMVGLWAVFRICRQLSDAGPTRAFIFLGSLSSASVVLFFGYIENYTWAFALAMWTVSFSMGYVRKENGAIVLIVVAVLAAFLHMITLPFLLVAFMSLALRRRSDGNYVLGMRLKNVNLGLVVGSFLLVGLAHLISVDIFVPFLARDGNPYSLLAADHIVDVVNQAAMVAPLGIGLVFLTLSYLKDRRLPVSAEGAILGTLALLLFVAAVWIDPELGAPRDWDLLSFYGLPLTIWGLYRFGRYFPDRRVARPWLVAAGVVAGITLVANLYEKNHPELAVARLDALLNVDAHYQASYDSASRCEPWAVALQKGYGDMRRAIKYLERRITARPDSHNAHFNLADSYYYLGIPDSAYMYVCRGLRLKSDEASKLVNASTIAKELGKYSEAVMWAQKAVYADPADNSALTQLGVSLTFDKRSDEALPFFRRAFDLAPQIYDNIVNMGMAHALTKSADSAHHYYVRALPISPNDRKADIYYCLVSLCIDLGRLDEAGRYLNALRQIDPTSPDVEHLTSKLAEARQR